uniref:Uncharacterized protein n=1 Tax=Citrobacter freundii TaxID=546 RepID=A0A0K2S3P9_CITFR|nr:hypothetical protein [Citrobacter freundii]
MILLTIYASVPSKMSPAYAMHSQQGVPPSPQWYGALRLGHVLNLYGLTLNKTVFSFMRYVKDI